MSIKKLEDRRQWLCELKGHSYVKTEIDWHCENDRPISISWHLNEDQVEGETYLEDSELEELFWQFNVKSNESLKLD